MAKVIKTLRNNWKKSVFAAGLLGYGVNYGLTQLEIGKTMRVFCEQAVTFGDLPVHNDKPRMITVIVNPNANNRTARKNFDNYCAPLLHLAGVYVSVIETEKEGHGRDLVNKIDPKTDAIIVAGGDGTLSEVVTGLMRNRGELCSIPIGILPLGKTNTLAKRLFGSDSCQSYNGMANAAMTVIRGNTKPIDAIRIEVIEDDEEKRKPPVYGVGGIEWGLWREMKKRSETFWYFGPLKRYASLIFHGNALDHSVSAHIRYTKPCPGCSHCFMQRPDLFSQMPPAPDPSSRKWWNVLSLQNRRQQAHALPSVDYTAIRNDDCSVVEELAIKTSDLSVITSNDPEVQLENCDPHVLLSLAPKIKYQGELLFDGIKAIREGKPVIKKIEVKQIEIRPENKESSVEGPNLSIDNEEYDVKPIRVTVLPNAIKMFCP